MLKKLLIIISLFILLIFGINYLLTSINDSRIFDQKQDILPIIITKDKITIQKGDRFYPEIFIDIYYPGEYELLVDKNFNTNIVKQNKIRYTVYYGDSSIEGTLFLDVVEREKETIEKVVEKVIVEEKVIYKTDENKDISSDVDTEQAETIYEEVVEEIVDEKPYFEGYKDIMIAKDSSINDLAKRLSEVRTNVQVSIDYSSVNLSDTGQYPVYYYTEIGDFMILVNVY